MEEIDTQKLDEILATMKTHGAVFLKFGELIIEFPRNDGGEATDGIGFSADTDDEDDEDDETTEPTQAKTRAIPIGYTKLFPAGTPKFPNPSATGG